MLVQQVGWGLAPPQGSWTVWLPKPRAGRQLGRGGGTSITKDDKSVGFLFGPTLCLASAERLGEVADGLKSPFIYGVHRHWVEPEFLGQPCGPFQCSPALGGL